MSKLPNFDPRKVPVAATDGHLPAVGPERLNEQALRLRFASKLPWQPEVREEPKYADRAPMHAAVLVPLVMREHLSVLLTERTAHLSTHSGQIAFPGGKSDPEDADAAATALREAHEEVGLAPGFVKVLGTLPHYVTGTSFIITPVVALVQPGFDLVPNAFEVADVFEVPLHFLMNPAHHQRHVIELGGMQREWFSMPYPQQAVPGEPQRFIWGATAGMLRNLYRFLSA